MMFALEASRPASPRALPSRFVEPTPELRRRYGDRFERMGAFLGRGDPLADAAAQALANLPEEQREATLEAALRRGSARAKDAPAEVRALLAEAEHVPLWLDPSRADRGGAVLLGSGWFGGAVLALRSLVLGYCSPAGNKPLVFSGRLRQDAPRRLAETSRFVQAVSMPGGMALGADGFAITVRVRLMHAKVRTLLRRSPRWDTAAWGEPINQVDMAGTILLFSLVLLDGLRAFGLRIPAADAEDLLHLWRYVGVVIGVDPELLPTGEASARELWDLVTGSQAPPDADARALAAALLETPLAQARTAEQRKKAEGMVRVSYTLSRFLLGDEAADALGYPRYRAGRLLAALPLALGPAHDALRRTPFGAHWLAAAGHRHWANVVEQSLAGRPATFAMPEVVAAGGAAAKPPRP